MRYVCSNCDDYEQYILEVVQLAIKRDSGSCLFPEVNPCWMEFITGWLTIWEKPCSVLCIILFLRKLDWCSGHHTEVYYSLGIMCYHIKFNIKITYLLTVLSVNINFCA